MGISIYYTSARAVSVDEADAIRAAATAANQGHSWLSSEPVNLFPAMQDGKLAGGSKPNFTPHPDDKACAAASALPDGGPLDVISILCRLSRDHRIDWQVMHDFGPLGFIRNGVADAGLTEQVEALAGLGDALGELDDGDFT